MKKTFTIFTILAIFSLSLTSCPTPEDGDKTPEIKTTLTIKNQCFSDLIDVKWDSDIFADKENSTLSISSSVKKDVSAGSGYIYFSRKQNPVIARTKEIVTIEKGQDISFVFMDNTLVVEASNPDNTGNLKDLISRLITPSKPVLTAKDGTIEAAWQAVEGATSYRVYIAETATAPAEAAKTVTEPSTTITGLTNEKTYYVWVQAVNARTESELSPAAQKTLTLGVPQTPALVAGNGSITATWNPVDMATSYRVYISTTNTVPSDADRTINATTATFSGLSNQTTYYIWVQAANAGGSSVLSERAQLTLTLAAPQVTLTAGNGSITASWGAVSTASSYKVYFSTTTTRPTEANQTVTAASAIFAGLTNETTYYAWVQAVNAGGTGILSEREQMILTLAAPQVTLTAGNGSITASWEAVNTAASYKVYFSTTTTRPVEANQTVTATSVIFGGLTNETTYYVWVQAVNSGGESAISSQANLKLTLAKPAVPTLTAGNGSITASWGAVSTAASYKVYLSTTTTLPTEADQIITSTSATFTGLTAGTTYYVWVQAVNSGGESAISDRATILLPTVTTTLSWFGSWTKVSDNKYTSNAISTNSTTWETLTIKTSSECIVLVMLTASCYTNSDYCGGYASKLDGSQSTDSSKFQFRVTGTTSQSYIYTVPAGTHYLYFGYWHLGNYTGYNGNVTVTVTVQ